MWEFRPSHRRRSTWQIPSIPNIKKILCAVRVEGSPMVPCLHVFRCAFFKVWSYRCLIDVFKDQESFLSEISVRMPSLLSQVDLRSETQTNANEMFIHSSVAVEMSKVLITTRCYYIRGQSCHVLGKHLGSCVEVAKYCQLHACVAYI